ncbi:MAG: hypothetical protein P1U83_02935 [Roseovarius sp.]|nr:hypothetical protein [Roseovarius sp.]
MKHGALSLLLLALPMAAQSASGDLTPMAGREAANERAEFYVVPHEQLVFSRMNTGNLSAFAAFAQEGAEGGSMASFTAHMTPLGLIATSECSRDGTEFLFSQLPNLKRRGITAVADVSDDVVSEILAFVTTEISRPNERLAQAS